MAQGFNIRLEGAWARAGASLQRLARLRLTDLHDAVGEHLVSATRRRFKEGRDPEGRAWPKLKKRKGKKGKAAKPLLLSGRLRSSITAKADQSGVAVGTNVVYAARHNFGFEQNGVVWTPKRQFLGISPDDESAIVEIVEDFVADVVEL